MRFLNKFWSFGNSLFWLSELFFVHPIVDKWVSPHNTMWTIILKKVQFELTKKKFNFFQRPFPVEPCLDRTTSLRRHKIFPFIIFPFTFFPFLAHSNNENVLSTFPFAKCLSSDDSFFVFVREREIQCTHFRNHTFGVWGKKTSTHRSYGGV